MSLFGSAGFSIYADQTADEVFKDFKIMILYVPSFTNFGSKEHYSLMFLFYHITLAKVLLLKGSVREK